MKPVPAGTVNETNTGSGNTTNWGGGTKPYTAQAFSIGETEVTYELWEAVYDWATDAAMEGNVYTFANTGRQGGDNIFSSDPVGNDQHPVTTINWRDAVVWCNAYSEAAGRTPVYYYNGAVLRQSEGSGVNLGKADQAVINPGNGYRLPTSAHWEYAARGGVPSAGEPWTFTYAGSNTADDVAWTRENSVNATHQVKTKDPNTLGLYDMTGNVQEWCQDGSGSANIRVRRGGYWGMLASTCAVSVGGIDYNYEAHSGRGLRVVCP
jgi:formylglycine-generating enzyme required for sulfatase activity